MRVNDNKTAYSGKDYPVHSNAPWRIECENVKTAISSGHKHIAMVSYFDCGTGDPRSISKEEHEANAKLIAAAPEMLEALRRVDNYFTQPGEDDWISFCKEALGPVRRAIKLAMEC
jgi:hypothetical protein